MFVSASQDLIDSSRLSSITYSLAVAEHLGFRQAALALGVNQSTLSRQVQALEDHLQISLFERGSRGSRSTAAGERFLARARGALSDIGHAAASARSNEKGEEGRLTLGFHTPLNGGLLPKLIRRYVTVHQNVSVVVREDSRRALLTAVRERQLDIAFVIGADQTSGCSTSALWNERIYAVLPEGHALADHPEVHWVELKDEHFVTTHSERGADAHDQVLLNMKTLGHWPEVEHLPVARDSLLSLIAMGFGVGIASEAGVSASIPGVVFRPLIGPTEVVKFIGAWSMENSNPALRQFISLAHVMAGRPRRGSSDWTGQVA